MDISNEMSKKIQICRSIAIICVVIIHNSPSGIFGGGVRLFVNFCVALFIFLSGFLTKKDISIAKIKNRILRVLIPYLIWSFIYTIASRNFDGFIFRLLTGQCCFPYYFILVYIQLTVLLPLFIKVMDTKWWKYPIFISPLVMIVQYILIKNNLTIPAPWNANIFFVWASFFYLGLCIRNEKINPFAFKQSTLAIFGCLGFILNLCEMLLWMHLNNFSMATTQIKLSNFVFSFFVCIVASRWIINSDLKTFNNHLLINLGDCSFGIYLIHILIMKIFDKTIYKYLELPIIIKIMFIVLFSMLVINTFKTLFGKKWSKIIGFE